MGKTEKPRPSSEQNPISEDLWHLFVWSISNDEIDKSQHLSSKERKLISYLKPKIARKFSQKRTPERWPDFFHMEQGLLFDIRAFDDFIWEQIAEDNDTVDDLSLYPRIALFELVNEVVRQLQTYFTLSQFMDELASLVLGLVREHKDLAGRIVLMADTQGKLKANLPNLDKSREMFGISTKSVWIDSGIQIYPSFELDLVFFAGLFSANVRDEIHRLLNSWLGTSKHLITPWRRGAQNDPLSDFYSNLRRQTRPFRFAGIKYTESDHNPFESYDGSKLMRGWEKVDETSRDGFVAIPSDLDIETIESLSDRERELIDTIKWRITHVRYSWDRLLILWVDANTYSRPISSFNHDIIQSIDELRRGFENTRPALPRLRFEKDQDPFLYPRIALHEVFEDWRTALWEIHGENLQAIENDLSPLILELVKRYDHMALAAFQEPIIRDYVLRDISGSNSSISFEDRSQADEIPLPLEQLFWLVLLSGGLRNEIRHLLDIWWEKGSIEARVCMVCNREFTLRERYRSGVERYVVGLCDEYFKNLCLRCPVVKFPRTISTLSLNIQNYVEACGFIPMRSLSPTDPILPQRIEKERIPDFLKAWGAIGGTANVLETTDNSTWISTLLDLEVFPGQVVRTTRGYHCVAEDGAYCRSLDEKYVDDLLSHLGKDHEHEPHYPYDSELNPHELKRADWKVGNVYIEYFGLISNEEYAQKVERKQLLAKKFKLLLLPIYPNDMINMTGEKLSRMLNATGLN